MDGVTQSNWYGWPCFFGRGHPKAAMQAHAATLPGPVLQLQVTRGYGRRTTTGWEHYGRSFVAVPDITSNIDKLVNILKVQLPPWSNHVNEIIVKGRCCKIVMDFDREGGFPADQFVDRDDFCRRVECALTKIMSGDFGITLHRSSFVWLFTEYSYKPKFSAHLVIHHKMLDGSLLVLPCHKHTAQHAGSRHFLDRLLQELPGVDTVKDYNIYSDDREMRMPLACKPNEKHMQAWTPGTLEFADAATPYAHAMVTYFDGRPLHVLQLPTVEPARTVKPCRGAIKALNTSKRGPPSHLTLSDVEQRMVELLRVQHPTVYLWHRGDVMDRCDAPRFNHTDRSEPCWCGKAHNSNNYSAWFSGNEAWVYCWATHRAFLIGYLEDDLVDASDVEVHLRYLDRRPDPTLGTGAERLDKEVACFLEGRGAVLGLQSPMGTGKTFMLRELVRELDSRLGRPARVCIIVYRTALAHNMHAALESWGFVNYVDEKGTGKLRLADKCIVQLDSVAMLLHRERVVPRYDLVVLDESESTLHHATAKTHGTRQRGTFDTFCAIVKNAERVLAADALLGKETRSFLRALGKEPRIVRNTWRSDKPRTFVFTNDQDTWLSAVLKNLTAGRNCAVASMSSSKLHILKKHLVATGALQPEEILVYDSETDDNVKKRVKHVNTDWAQFRLVMWSPAVEAGIDFNVPHFHSMFVIVSGMSTVAMGAVQSTGRIRLLQNPLVLCWCQWGVAWDPKGHEMRPEEAVEHLRWHQAVIQDSKLDKYEADILTVGEEVLTSREVALLPRPDTLGMVVASHNYARIINSRERLLPEIIKLLEQQGHMCLKGPWHDGKPPKPEVDMEKHNKASDLLAAHVIKGPEELQVLLRLQSTCQLTRGEKQALRRWFYCQSHRIENASLDEQFLRHHPAEDEEASCLRVLLAALGHTRWLRAPCAPLVDDGKEMVTPVHARGALLAEALQALGVSNILACGRICLTPDKLEALKRCRPFAHAKETQRVFEIDSKGHQSFEAATGGSFASRLKAMLQRAGLRCVGKAKQHQGANGSRVYMLSFEDVECKAQQQAMAKLVKLAAGHRQPDVWLNRDVYDFLQQLALDDYAKYERRVVPTVTIDFGDDACF